MEVRERYVGRSLGSAIAIVVLGAVVGGSVGCAGATQQLQTPRYSLSYPGFWKVKQVGIKDGDATVVSIGQYGDAVIDEGTGAMGPKSQNYEAVLSDVDARLYAWSAPAGLQNPTWEVSQRLGGDKDLELSAHSVVLDNPPECGMLRRKYQILGTPEAPLDLVRRRFWRTIVVGGASNGVLVGAVARVFSEQDMNRYCQNLKNLQVQLQTLLDGLSVGSAAVAAPAAPPPSP